MLPALPALRDPGMASHLPMERKHEDDDGCFTVCPSVQDLGRACNGCDDVNRALG